MQIHFLVEEPSMKALLERLLPRIFPDDDCQVFDYRSKEQLLIHLPQRLKGYADMIKRAGYENLRIVVLIDRDRDDCHNLKNQLEQYAWAAELTTLSTARPSTTSAPMGLFHVVNRIVCEELEAWYFGDPVACETAYPRLKRKNFTKSHLEAPDSIVGTWEAFGRTLYKAGHLPANPPNHRWKYEAADVIGAYLDPDRNTSPSFQAFIAGIRAIKTAS
jgi:hypothetical protein